MVRQERLEDIFDRPFKDEGENYSALCPVHDERKPSFYVHKEDLIYHCFSCKAGGRLLNLVKDYRGVDEQTATSLLGMTGEALVWAEFNHIIPAKRDPPIYPESWLAPFQEIAHKYVIRRGFKISTLLSAGALYDHHRKRQVFPHRNRKGRLVGAIGRSCREQNPKWHYYWKYPKGAWLYLGGRVEGDRPVWITEGVFDALWLNQHGTEAVAILGSKASERQIQEIKDNYDSIVIAMDNDEAGEQGSKHLYENLRKSGIKIEFPIWPKDVNDIMEVDPAELELTNIVSGQFIHTSD